MGVAAARGAVVARGNDGTGRWLGSTGKHYGSMETAAWAEVSAGSSSAARACGGSE